MPSPQFLSAPLPAGLPTEFRLFKAGVNQTAKGDYLFDAKAAASVMNAYKRNGVQIPLDLEHESLAASAPRSDSRDARGWMNLEVRNGELWATSVTWTPDGARRLQEKTQRFVSPAFLHDSDGRITELCNAAIVAMPATYGATPLVAAGRYTPRNSGVVAARLPRDQIKALRATAARIGVPVGQYVRACLTAALVPGKAKNAQAIFKRVGQDLGMVGASPAEIVAALDQMLKALEASGELAPATPSGEAAQETASRATLSAQAPLSATAQALAADMPPEQRTQFERAVREREAHRNRLKAMRARPPKIMPPPYK